MTDYRGAATRAVLDQTGLVSTLFDDLRARTSRGAGIVRAAYGPGENAAHALMADCALTLGLEVERDAAANTYMTLPGRDRLRPRVLIGSHLDSVADGGNFDGAAGVVAGLAAVAAMKAAGFAPVNDITVVGIRAEESVWFSSSYFGSKAALGVVPAGVLDTLRSTETGKTLAEHVAACGGDPEALRAGAQFLQPARIKAYLEVHIEQGPVLDYEGLPIAIVTGIRGNRRFPEVKVHGEYNHCGGVPRAYRHDSVVAASEFVQRLGDMWEQWELERKDMAFTVGRFFTSSDLHAVTKIAGEVTFSLDLRSVDSALLAELEARVIALAGEIGARRGVRFELGEAVRTDVGRIAPEITARLAEGSRALGMTSRQMDSGASHDAAAFAQAGVPTGMIFVRNANGSHNPNEAMKIEDLLEATRLLTWWLATECVD